MLKYKYRLTVFLAALLLLASTGQTQTRKPNNNNAAAIPDSMGVLQAIAVTYQDAPYAFSHILGDKTSEEKKFLYNELIYNFKFKLPQGFRGSIVQTGKQQIRTASFIIGYPDSNEVDKKVNYVLQMIQQAIGKPFSIRLLLGEGKDAKFNGKAEVNAYQNNFDSLVLNNEQWNIAAFTAKGYPNLFMRVSIPQHLIYSPDPNASDVVSKVFSSLSGGSLPETKYMLFGTAPFIDYSTAANNAHLGYSFDMPAMNLNETDARKIYAELKTYVDQHNAGTVKMEAEMNTPEKMVYKGYSKAGEDKYVIVKLRLRKESNENKWLLVPNAIYYMDKIKENDKGRWIVTYDNIICPQADFEREYKD